MQIEHIHGVIDKKNNIIPKRIFICELNNSSAVLTILTAKIITGILKIIIIRLPIEKFLLFKRFIEPEIEAIQVMITEPIIKLK